MPVHVALLGSAIAKKMAAVLPEPAKTRSRNLAEALEDWAYGLLETANTTNANKILQLQVCEAFIRPNATLSPSPTPNPSPPPDPNPTPTPNLHQAQRLHGPYP